MVFSWLHFTILLFLAAGFVFAASPILLSRLLAPRARGGDLGMPYECGMKPLGSSWGKFNVTYYLYALIFLAFDVDVLYLFPVAVYYHVSEGWLAFFKVLIFLSFLAISILYFWFKGVFTWPRKISVK